MAKVSFSKLNAKVNTDIEIIELEEGKKIEILQYLPTEDKISLITRVIEFSHDPSVNYMNPIKTDVYLMIELFQFYTNISFTEKQLENPQRLYDQLISSGWGETIVAKIPKEEIKNIKRNISKIQNAFYTYRNSAAGILDIISTDYSDLNLDVAELERQLANGENIELVKGIMSRLG